MTATTASRARSEAVAGARKLAKSKYAVPVGIAAVALAFFAASLGRGLTSAPSPAETAAAAAAGAQQGALAVVSTTAQPAPGAKYFDYLGPLLAYPMTEEAKSIITFEPGSRDLHMGNSQAVAQQILAVPAVDQCKLTIGIEQQTGQDGETIRVRVVYPPALDGTPRPGKVPLVTCTTGADTPGKIPTVTTAGPK